MSTPSSRGSVVPMIRRQDPPEDDGVIVARIAGGNLAALGVLHDRHSEAVRRFVLRATSHGADADDLVQETMLKAYRAWDQYEKGTNAKAWLLTILRHAFINEYRRRTRHPETVDVDTIEPYAVFSEVQDEDPQGAFFDRIVDDEVLRAIDQLPEVFRETLVLSDVEGMSYQEIAGILEVPIGTVKSRLFRARQLLQTKLYDYAVEMGYIKGSPA